MENIIFRLITTGMRQRLIPHDLDEVRKIASAAVIMMKAHYEDKILTIPTIEEMMDDETKEAVRFITDNPDQEKYISENLRHFTTGDEPDDNSIRLYNSWCAEYTKVVDWLKSKLAEPMPDEKKYIITACNNWMPDKGTSATRCANCGKDRWEHEL